LKQITIRQLVRQSSQLQKWLPCQVVRDGEVIALMLPPNVSHDVIQAKDMDSLVAPDVRQATRTTTKSDKLTELPLSKKRQASGRLSDSERQQ